MTILVRQVDKNGDNSSILGVFPSFFEATHQVTMFTWDISRAQLFMSQLFMA